MIDRYVEVDGVRYEITDKGEMYMVTIASTFIGYIAKSEKEYLGKTLPDEVVAKILKVVS